MSLDKTRIVTALLIAVSLVTLAMMFSSAWQKTHTCRQLVTVTGHGQQNFSGKLIAWKSFFSRQPAGLSEADKPFKNAQCWDFCRSQGNKTIAVIYGKTPLNRSKAKKTANITAKLEFEL